MATPTPTETKPAPEAKTTANGSHSLEAHHSDNTGVVLQLTTSTLEVADEAIAVVKAAANELLDLADSVALATLDELDAVTNDARAFAPFASAPLKVARASWSAGANSTRRMLHSSELPGARHTRAPRPTPAASAHSSTGEPPPHVPRAEIGAASRRRPIRVWLPTGIR